MLKGRHTANKKQSCGAASKINAKLKYIISEYTAGANLCQVQFTSWTDYNS